MSKKKIQQIKTKNKDSVHGGEDDYWRNFSKWLTEKRYFERSELVEEDYVSLPPPHRSYKAKIVVLETTGDL